MLVKTSLLVLEIPSQINEYRLFIDKCCDFVGDVSVFTSNYSKMAKFKLVIMELLTNAMKHCKAASSIEIEKNTDSIKVYKIDNGQKFFFKDAHSDIEYHLPVTNFEVEKEIKALLANNYKIPVLLKSHNHVEFLEPEIQNYYSVMDIPEHFGLMIIKQCSDSFSYRFDTVTHQNIFEVIFNLK